MFQEAIDPPERLCPEKLGGILSAFPPVPLLVHERNGFTFNPPPCGQVLTLDPDYCITTVKMDPQGWRPAREAILSAVQSAVNCSLGVTEEKLRQEAKNAIDQNLSRAIETDLVDALISEAVPQGSGLTATCVLADAALFLAVQGECTTGVIIGPVDWFTSLTKDSLIWNGKYHTDVSGNIVLSHSVNNSTVFAFDSNVIIKTSEVDLLDEFMPGQRERNDRIVRGEMLYAIAISPCVVGSWTFVCCPCSGGGGTSEPSDPVDVSSHHFDVLDGTPWTPAVVTGVITGLTYTILSGTATIVDSNSVSIAGLPVGLSGGWNNDEEGTLFPPLSITAAADSRVYVLWTER